MADLYTRKATFESVKRDLHAVAFHKSRFENGSVDLLAKQCFQYWQQLKTNPEYAKHLLTIEGE